MCPDLERADIMESLREQNKEFRSLEEKHKEYEAILDEFKKRAYLTPDQEVSRQVLKKKKLWIKDRMAEIINEFLTKDVITSNEASPRRQAS